MRKVLTAFLLPLAVLLSCSGPDRYVAFSGYAQGGTYTVKANLKGVKERPGHIAAQIDTLLEHIDRSISGYNKGSILSRLNAGGRAVPDSLLIRVYELSYDFFLRSGGAFDVAGGPLYDAWGFGFKTGEMPSGQALAAAMEASGMGRLTPDIRSRLAPDGSLALRDLLNDPTDTAQVALNFNAIAQGYSCDVIASYLHELGIRDMLVDIGEIYCEGLNPSGRPWSIGIDRPAEGNDRPGKDLQGIWLSSPMGPGQGVVTSGNYRKFYIRDGRRYAHTIDPRSGRPVEHNLLSATVIAQDAATADAIATWCMVAGADEALRLLAAEGLEGCLICGKDSSMVTLTTPGFALE